MATRKQVLYRRVFVWSGALRIFHWAFAISTLVLILTGLYIHYPPVTTKWAEFKPQYLMATLRYYHFTAAYFFMAALIIRFYLLLFGNRYERFTDFLPINQRNIHSFWQSLRFYLYLTDEHEWRMGHTVLAGTIYFALFVAAVVMTLSGLYLLYPETGWINAMGVVIFGSPQQARFIHYLLHWAFIFFVVVHLYIAVWNDFKAPEAIISGAVSGCKFMPADQPED
ncbi:Ni/Fe-hydrogenase, b-type cytochrome subunit [Thermosulfuriphilus ammonigenes]|uniref:Ni/Fe-hydrogenase, b-type cytochrome subunit n=1 Tax=Thermosulfuriphilus ammonigenes TaxID=1936021 RepID=A0A6G7PVI6_9BACT|nr:Ni/Fe-hydrogenase, b-type cytochrome subunit [Thermosulfuriphilus ammonigenes]MBA2848129.1 Ni/Fe-hydrogenase 1 B-type cytochrome subunit [Thermosulfuriphilus ammonigenes]QIJ71695.1 Ni/Fe-hydrogenase, b-type cytochrome subunit [Thermosulfuriphilus ammonigenes]